MSKYTEISRFLHSLGGELFTPNEPEGRDQGDQQPIVIPPDGGKVLRFIGIKHRLTPQQTGGAAHLPKTIPHALYNPLKTPSWYLAMAIPGGMEKFFDELELAMEGGTLDDRTHKNISLRYGIEWLE